MRTKSMERNPWTSSVVEGPPIFMKTIAVGPLEPVLASATGATVAFPLRHCTLDADMACLPAAVQVARCAAWARGIRRAISEKYMERKDVSSG